MNDKLFSHTEALLKKVENFNYEGCSVCRRKVVEGRACTCAPNTDIRVYLIQKVTLVGSDESILEAAVFEEDTQKAIMNIKEPAVFKFNIKSTKKVLPTGEHALSHVITKISL